MKNAILIFQLLPCFAFVVFADSQRTPLSARSWQCQEFNLESFCGYVFGSELPENATTNSIRKKLDKPFRACTHVKLGYTNHTRKLFRVDLESDLDGWSFAAITNEAEIVKCIIEDKLGIPIRESNVGIKSFSNSHMAVTILAVFQKWNIKAQLKNKPKNYFCIRVESKDVFEESERLQKEWHEKQMHEINYSIPPEQDKEFITFTKK